MTDIPYNKLEKGKHILIWLRNLKMLLNLLSLFWIVKITAV